MSLTTFPPEPTSFTRQNRRSYPRTGFCGPVLLDTGDACITAQGIDVSAGGIRLKSDRPLPLGSTLEVYFELNQLAVEAKAEVVHSHGKEAGLAFDRGRRRSTPAAHYSFRPRAA